MISIDRVTMYQIMLGQTWYFSTWNMAEIYKNEQKRFVVKSLALSGALHRP